MIAQSQNGQLVTCTATLNDVTISNVSIAQFGAAFAAWIEANPAQFFALFSAAMNTLPATTSGQSVGQMINVSGLLEQVQS